MMFLRVRTSNSFSQKHRRRFLSVGEREIASGGGGGQPTSSGLMIRRRSDFKFQNGSSSSTCCVVKVRQIAFPGMFGYNWYLGIFFSKWIHVPCAKRVPSDSFFVGPKLPTTVSECVCFVLFLSNACHNEHLYSLFETIGESRNRL